MTLTPRYARMKTMRQALKKSDQYLFEGDSCYPISPCEEMLNTKDEGKGVYSSED